MDTSNFGPLPFLLAAAKAAIGRRGRALFLFWWLAHCDDATNRDIIIILINIVNCNEQHFHFNFGW